MTLEQAEMEIAQMLCQLEKDTGNLVRSICCSGIDITNMTDARPQHQMRVLIELERLPGHGW